MNHQAIIEQLSQLAPKLKASESPEAVLVKYASDRNLSPAQLERIGQVYNIAKTLNFMDKSANRGDSFRVLDTQKMMSDFTAHKPATHKAAAKNTDWNNWFDSPTSKAASSSNPDDINSWIDESEKFAKIVEEDGKFTVYSEDGSKRLSKPGTKADAVKRLREVEYFKKHKKANTVPNLGAIALNDNYSSTAVDLEQVEIKSAAEQIKNELREETYARFELETAQQIMDDAAEEARKIATELLEMHRVNSLPFATMERDAHYCSEDTGGIKLATEFVANFFKAKGWDLERHDFTKDMPKLARDTHNVLPLFNSLLEQLELNKSASAYVEELKKAHASKSAGTSTSQRSSTGIDFYDTDTAQGGKTRNNKSNSVVPSVNKAIDSGLRTSLDAAKEIYGTPETYLNKQTLDFINSIQGASLIDKTNKTQKKVDIALDDVSRVTELQRLLLTDPIIGEADPDTVVSLYNTLASANPEIVKDRNLLRFALREALQYDAVPLHTYKDLISMGKDRAQMTEINKQLDSEKYNRY